MSKNLIYTILLLIAIVIVGYFGYDLYAQTYLPVNNLAPGEYTLEIQSGQGIRKIASQLEEKGLVRSQLGVIIANQLGSRVSFLEGEYTIVISESDGPREILQQLADESQRIANLRAEMATREIVSITFREGYTLDKIAFKLEENGVVSYQDFTEFAKNPNNFDRESYSFLPEPLDCKYGDITTCAKYYPEGYLYPDTYEFFVDSSVQIVFNRFFDNFQNRVWNNLSESELDSDLGFHDAVILASVIEKETGRPASGVSESNQEEVNIERKKMAQVFRNRTRIGMKWRSDVTAEYGQFDIQEGESGNRIFVNRKLCQQTFKVENCLFLDNPKIQNLYNTYYVNTPPIGPVTNPQFDNIFAALNPIDNNYLFFVSDITGKKYFSETEAQFNQSIRDVQVINRRLEAGRVE